MNQVETFTYDVAGRLVSSTDRNGAVSVMTYDLMGNILTKNTSKSGSTSVTKTNTYDNMGNLLTVNDGNGLITYTYDGRGNRLTETQGNILKTFEYNNIGSMISSEIKINGTIQQSVSYEYNNLGKTIKVFEDGSLVTSYKFDSHGREITATNENGVVQTTERNAAGLPVSVKNTVGNAVISEYVYTYYYDGNQQTKTEAEGVTSYFYDGLNRLEKAVLHDGTVQEYEFDKNGNRTKLTSTKDGVVTITTYTYDKNDRLITETKDGVTTNYGYDANGNMTAKSGGVNVTQTFDLLNRMTSFFDGAVISTYAYNPDNMRSSKTVDGVTTEHIWIGSEIALDKTGSVVVSYIQGRRGVKSDYGWYVFNANGDVVQLADDNGVVIRFYDYDPFGVQLSEVDDADLNPYRYNGQYYDHESGYIYLLSFPKTLSRITKNTLYNWV